MPERLECEVLQIERYIKTLTLHLSVDPLTDCGFIFADVFCVYFDSEEAEERQTRHGCQTYKVIGKVESRSVVRNNVICFSVSIDVQKTENQCRFGF